MNLTSSRRRLLALSAVAGLTIAAWSASAHAGKPRPPTPVPKLRIQFFDVPNPAGEKYVTHMNNRGQVVGDYRTATGERHAFLYDPAIDPELAMDLHDLIAVPEGWVIARAFDVNDFGAVVGSLNPIGDETVSRGFVCDLSAATPVLQSLPDASTITSGYRINENGDVLGKFKNADGTFGLYVYNCGLYGPADAGPTVLSTNVRGFSSINNPVGTRDIQVVDQDGVTGVPFRWTRGQGFEYFPQIGTCGVYDINDSGTFCGWSEVTIKSGKQSNVYRLPMRYNTALQTLSGGYTGELAGGINSSGDVVTTWDRLYSDLWGFMTFNSLVDPADPNAAVWNSRSNSFSMLLNDRDATTKCGQVSGAIWWADGTEKFFLLTPVGR